jgi:hypothetical protein
MLLAVFINCPVIHTRTRFWEDQVCHHSIFQYRYFLRARITSRIATFCGVRIPVGAKIFSSLHPSCGSTVLLHNCYWGSFPGEKRSERGLDHSPPSSTKVEMGTSVPGSPSVPALERDGLNFLCVCYMSVCAVMC